MGDESDHLNRDFFESPSPCREFLRVIRYQQHLMDKSSVSSHRVTQLLDDLGQYEKWRPYLHDPGPVGVQHGVRVEVVNFYTDEVGNSELPEKVKDVREQQTVVDLASFRPAGYCAYTSTNPTPEVPFTPLRIAV